MKVKANGAAVFWMPLPDSSTFAVSESMTEALRESCSNQAKSATDYGLKIFELANANATAAIDFMIHLGGSRTPADVLKLSAAQTRKALVTASDQNTELWTLAQKLAAETARPLRQHFGMALHIAG